MAKKAAKKVAKKTRVSTKTVKTGKAKSAKSPKAAKSKKVAKKPVKTSAKPAAKKVLPSKSKKADLISKKKLKLERKKTRISTKIEATKPTKHKVAVRETTKPSKIVNNDAPKKTKVAKKPTMLSEQAVLDKLKELFPASLGRKRVIENIKLDAKQLKKLEKLPKFRARIPVDVKRSLGIVDDSVREAEEAEKAAKIRVVDTEKAKDASDILAAIEAAKVARGDVQTSKIIKAVQLRLNRRLVSVYGNYKKIITQFNTFSSVAMSDLSKMYASRDPHLAGKIEDQVTKVSSVFRLEESNDYDYFDSEGSKLDIDFAAPLDAEGNYVDEDMDGSLDNASLILPPENQDMQAQAAAGNDLPDHDSGSDSSYDDNDSMFGDEDSSTDSDPNTFDAASLVGKNKAKKPRIKKNKINILGTTRIKYADKAFMAYKNAETRNLFGTTKRAACVGFNFGVIDKHGNFSTSTQVKDSQGNVHVKSDVNTPVHGDTSIPLHANSVLFDDFISLLSRYMGMRISHSIGLTHVCSKTAFNFLKIHGLSSNYRVLVRNNADNTGRYGVIISVSGGDAGTCRVLVIPFGIVGITHKEITTLCQGEFQDVQDKLFEYVSYSIITNGLMSQGKVFGFSKKERSLLEPLKREGDPVKDDIIKLANGHIYFLPDIDRRNEFASYRESLRLPDQLDDELTDESGLTEYDKFVGAIAYVDHKSKIAFYYTKNGKLESTVFNGACSLNARDCADIMKPTPTLLGINQEAYDPTQEEHRKNMSPYGTVTLLPARYLGKDNVRTLESFGHKYPDGFHGFYDSSHIKVTAEDLRTSFQGDKIYYNMVKEAIDNYLGSTVNKLDRDSHDTAGNAYTLLSKAEGLTDLDWATASQALDSSRERLTGRDATAIKIMLHIAAKSYEEWPIAEDWQKRAEDARVKPPSASDLQDIIGQYDGLIRDVKGNAASAMPHQAYTLHTLKHQETAALDCDMGGGKTFMSCLDATRWIREGVHGKPARPCVVMPASLIENYMTDIKNNFFGSNLKFFVLSSSTRSWSKMDTSKIAELAKSAPANTMFVASYEWLGLDSYPVILGTHLQEKPVKAKDSKGKKIKLMLEVPHTENIYPNAQLLLDIGINVLYLDESQKIKNPSSGFHKAVQTLSGIPIKRIMTGTMVTRDVDDVFTQTSFIDGTMIGTRRRFQTMYCENGSGTEIRKGLEKKVRVHLMASGVMQLRRSMWMGLLPKKKEHFEFVTLDGLHGAVYDVLIYDLLIDDKELNQLAYYSNNESLKAEAKSLLNKLLTGVDSDIDDDPALKDLERMRADACGDVTEDDDELASAGRAKNNKVQQYFERKRSMAEKVSMLQAFISSPQSLQPEKFSKNAQEQLKALNQQLPDFTAKDTRIVELIDRHWSILEGKKYYAMSRQREAYGDNPSVLRGKVIVFALNLSTVEHVYAYLKKSKYAKQVVRYLKSDAKAADNLRDFKDPENEDAAIIVAAETSVIYGQNMQSADMMIKLTIPWTTGDYDQAVARIFRNGQKLNCEVYNVVANGTFEIAKLAKFLIRQNSNRKLISDYTNPYNMNHALGAIGKGSAALQMKSENDMRNFVYEDQNTGREVKLDLIANHETIYEHELIEAEKHIKVFRDAGYGDPTRDRIEIASTSQVIDAETPSLRPRDADGVECPPGDFKYADMSYFDGDNITNARNVNRKSLTAEIKRQRDLELAQTMGDEAVNALNAKGADALLRQYMSKALEEVLSKYPVFKKFIPESGTKGFSVYLGDALRNGDFRLLNAKNMSYKNFAEVAGNDLEDPEVRAELMTLSRLVYNRVLSNYPGCVAIDDSVEVKYNKAGKAVDVIGHDEKKDRVLVKKNARIISSIVGNSVADTDKTETMKAAETAKQEAIRKATLEQEEMARKSKTPKKTKPVIEDDIVQEDEDVVEEGINLGVSELVSVDDSYEGTGVRNIPTNDSVYVFAPSFGNDPKQLRKLTKVNIGVGRGNKVFEKKVMWVYNKPVSDMNQVVTIATAIENAGGFVEKLGKGPSAKYAITTDAAAQALFRLKAPTNFSKIEEVGTSFTKHLSTVTAGLVKKAEVELGLYCFDRRILVVAESRNEVLLRQVGFKRIEVLRAAFDRTSKLQSQLETCFARIRKAGINILNSEILARRLKIIAGKSVEV